MLSFSSTNTHKVLSVRVLPVHSPPTMYLCLGLPQPRCRTLHLALLDFMRFVQVHLSNLSRSLCMASLPFNVLTTSYRLVSLANLLRVHTQSHWLNAFSMSYVTRSSVSWIPPERSHVFPSLSFISDVPEEPFISYPWCPLPDLFCQYLTFLTISLVPWTISVYSSQATLPCLHPL